jgi:tetratricopeptide (TPR) repeat protein
VCERLEDWPAVVAACDELLALQPGEPSVLYHRANAQYELHDWTAARADYARLTELVPDFTGGWNGLGSAYGGLGDHAAAAEAYRRAINLAPDQALLYRNRADAFIELGRLDEAEADCQKAQALEPDNPRTAGRWGQLRVAQHRFAEAEPLLRTAMAGTSLSDWGGWLALALLGQGKVGQAQEVLAAWTKIASPGDQAAWRRWCARLGLASPGTSEVSKTSEV